MTLEEIEARVQQIRDLENDPERAHEAEDQLWSDVLESIASYDDESGSRLAAAALETRKIKFDRWYA